MEYDVNVKLYYYGSGEGPSSDTRMVPAPLISIEPEILYVNDISVGYIYNITFNGYATALDLSNYNNISELTFTDTIAAIQKIRDIFSKESGTLCIRQGGSNIVMASGGMLESLIFEETENNWFNYAKYTARVSFENLDLGGCNSSSVGIDPCVLPSGLSSNNSPYIINMNKFRIKSVNDSWNIVADNIYDSNYGIGLENEYLDVTYTLQAIGKSIKTSSGIIPAWQQAKNYCLDRLVQEISRLYLLKIGPLTSTSAESTCTDNNILFSSFSQESTLNCLYELNKNLYKIYNETISVAASESDGSFNLTYKCIIKKKNNDSIFGSTDCIHKFSITTTKTNDETENLFTKTIKGEIQGLIEKGLIGDDGQLSIKIPDNGTITVNPNGKTRYEKAKEAYNKIGNQDLTKEFVVDKCNIKREMFDTSTSDKEGKPKKNSHTSIHNYNDGIISYSEDYNNKNIIKNSGIEVNNINISIEDSINQTAEFIIPGKSDGPLIQKLTAKKPKKVTISIDGISNNRCPIFEDICEQGLALPLGVPATGLQGHIITDNRHNFNYKDGSFTINRTYIKID